MKTRPTVYLIAQPTVKRNPAPGQRATQNIEPLYRHGDVVVLVAAGEYPTFNPERCLSLMEHRMADFDPERDFFAWAGGDTLSAVLVGNLLAQRGVKEIRWLRYERGRDGKTRTDHDAYYLPVTIPLVNYAPVSAKEPVVAPHDEGDPDAD